MENSKYHILLYGSQEHSCDDKFEVHEPPAYRSVYVSDVQIDEETGHLIVTLSDGTTIDSGYARGGQGIPGTPGSNGHSPVVTAEKSGKTTTVKVDGVAIATIIDGADGSPGPKGDSFQTSVEDDGSGNIVIKSLTSEEGGTGTPGATFTPSVSEEGVISWTNDGGLENPAPVSIKGAKGTDGKTPEKGVDYFTEADKTEMVNAVLAALPNGDEATYGSE